MVSIDQFISNTAAAGAPDGVPAGHQSGKLWRGFTMGDCYDYRWPTGGEIDNDMSDEPARMVRRYDSALALITYCEGDIHLEVYPTAESYSAAVESARSFYRTAA